MIRRTIKCIAFVLLMLSVVSIVMAAPTVIVIDPANSSTISGNYILRANVTPSENTTIESVLFLYKNSTSDWNLIDNGELSGGNYIYSWDTTPIENGLYQLNVTATDNTSSAISNTSIFFYVSNLDTTPPGSVSITGASKGATWIKWTWINPDDSDFNHTAIKITNDSIPIFQGNRTNTTTHFNTSEFSPLSPGISYQISIQTVDSSGNINQTSKTDTQHTLNTPAGSWVNIGLPYEAIINFSTVTSEGNTTASITVNPDPDSVRKLKPVSDILNITTTAITSGSITVGIKFNSSLVSALGYATSEVDLYHWNSSSSLWENITSSRDSDRVYGVISSPLSSIFMAGINDTTPPSNITGLSNISGYTWIRWTWINPGGDFDHTEVYLDRSFVMNTSNNYYNTSTNFTLGYKTTHSISLRPVDTSGNIGSWTNGTANTTAPPPRITRISPSETSFESIGIETKTFTIKLEDQSANITWRIGTNAWLNKSIPAGALVNFTYTPPSKGIYNVTVNATNENGTSNTIYWNWTVRPKTYKTGNRIWDGSRLGEFSLTYIWNPMSFSGFYYDIINDVGNESITIILDSYNDRTVDKGKLVYITTPQEVSFGYSGFGKYEVIGFMAEKYFAGYTANSRPPNPTESVGEKSVLAQGQLHKVLIDDDTKRTLYVGSTLTLKEGYVLKAKDIDTTARIMLLSLLKDGNEVDTVTLSANQTYVYTKKVGAVSDLPLIMVRFDSVFSGKEVQAAFLKGMFQISESATTVKTGNKFGKMEVRSVGKDKIEMSNDGSISLDKGRIDDLMGSIKLKVADGDALRFYLAVDVTPEMVANQLVIDAPAKANAGDAIKIKVTAGGNVVEGASISIDSSEAGQTDKNGVHNYTLPRSMKGIYNITANKLGYQKASKSIEVLEYIEYRLSIDASAKANQFETITIRVTSNGTAISGATVSYDNATIGLTDSKGALNYTLNMSGTHTISASKSGYITAIRNIEVRAPFSEYKALDININPNVIFTNEITIIRSNITNVGTKADTLPVELVLNGTVVDNKSVTLAIGEIKEINFTQKVAQAGNYTVEILGQKGLLEVKKEPMNYLLIGGIGTGFGVIIIYLLTAKNKISLKAIKKLLGKFGKKGVEKATSLKEGKV